MKMIVFSRSFHKHIVPTGLKKCSNRLGFRLKNGELNGSDFFRTPCYHVGNVVYFPLAKLISN